MDAAGENAHGVAVSLRNKSLQSYIWKFTHGRAKEPRRSSLQPLADRYRVPVEAFYDSSIAARIAAERGLLGGRAQESKPPPQAQNDDVMQALETLASALKNLDKPTREGVAGMLAMLAKEPEQIETTLAALGRWLTPTNLAHIPQDAPSAGRRFSSTKPTLEETEIQGHAKRNPDQRSGRP